LVRLKVKDVHKAPALDLVGWFTHTPPSGPQPHHLPIHRQLLETNESAVLLAFHPSLVASSSATGGKLPLTIYESVYEADSSENGGKTIDVETADTELKLRFKDLPYSIETGQAEMIGIDFVARVGGNAAAIESTLKETESSEVAMEKGKPMTRKGKERSTEYVTAEEIMTNGKSRESDINVLDPEDEERMNPHSTIPKHSSRTNTDISPVVASLTAKANAIKMLHSRIRLLNSYLSSLPPSHLTGTAEPQPQHQTVQVNHKILRSIQALTNRLPLIIPADRTTFETEMLAEKNDVSLVALLGSLSRSVRDMREVGRKFSVCHLTPPFPALLCLFHNYSNRTHRSSKAREEARDAAGAVGWRQIYSRVLAREGSLLAQRANWEVHGEVVFLAHNTA
jgi:COP9 signalosome complex subunit 6